MILEALEAVASTLSPIFDNTSRLTKVSNKLNRAGMPRSFLGNSFICGWRNSFRYRGRTSRLEYTSFLGCNFFVILILVGCWLAGWMSIAFPLIYVLASIFPMTAISLRRLNDTNKSWKLILDRKALSEAGPSDQEATSFEHFLLEDLPLFTWIQFPTFLLKVTKILSKTLFFIIIALSAIFPFNPDLPVVVLVVAVLAAIAIPNFTAIFTDIQKTQWARFTLSQKFNECYPGAGVDLAFSSSLDEGYYFYAGKVKSARGEFACLDSDGNKNTVFISVPKDKRLATFYIDSLNGTSCSDGLGCSDEEWSRPVSEQAN